MTEAVSARRLLAVVAALTVPLAAGCAAGRNDVTGKERTTPFEANADVGPIAVRDVTVSPVAGASPAPSAVPVVSPSGAAIGAPGGGVQGYLTLVIVNTGTAPDRLVGASLPDGGQVTPAGAGATSSGFAIAPGGTVSFGDPNAGATGPALVVTGVPQPLLDGTVLKVTLTFATAGAVPVEALVQPATGTTDTATPPAFTGTLPQVTPTNSASASS